MNSLSFGLEIKSVCMEETERASFVKYFDSVLEQIPDQVFFSPYCIHLLKKTGLLLLHHPK